MPDDRSPYNSMQYNMGLLPSSPGPVGMATPSPSDTSMRLMEESRQRVMHSQQTIQASSPMVASAFSNQFQQRFQQAQGIQSYSPYQAQSMGGYSPFSSGTSGPGGGPSYLPSPMTMTPASTGVFRPNMPSPIAPIPPMYTPPIVPLPFQPQAPQPMFQTQYMQHAMQSDFQSNRMFSTGMQIPAVMGQALGIGAGAAMGAKVLGRFGPLGAVAGAVGGGLLAGTAGVAESIGNFAQLPFQPMIETRQMGSAVQRMSQDWVVSGQQLHATGRGLSQGAGMSMAGQIKDLAGESKFKSDTGGMFNRQDLMKMTQLSGQSGLMDMEQSVPEIKNQLRQVASTVKKFMELTSDPDVTNVIRNMGRLTQQGMSLTQIDQAASGMRNYARMAGTSVAGIQQLGGAPGAMVFQGMGLSAAQGYDYGNFSMAMARQTVAGGMAPRQLSMLGGVQGMAQRDMQAQAAYSSMPLFAASNASFGSKGWVAGQSPADTGGGQGAFGMVNAAVSNLNAGVRKGGIGALVSYGLQQNEIADEATSKMTPMEQAALRFRTAKDTGAMLGLKGQAGFDLGARISYGDEVANQMSLQARNPRMWEGLRSGYNRELTEMAMTQRNAIESRAPGVFGRIGRDISRSSMGRSFKSTFSTAGGMAESLGDTTSDIANVFRDAWGVPDGMIRTRKRRGTGMTDAAADVVGRSDVSGSSLGRPEELGGMGEEYYRSSQYMHAVASQGGMEGAVGKAQLKASGMISAVTNLTPLGLVLDSNSISELSAGIVGGPLMFAGNMKNMADTDRLIQEGNRRERRSANIIRRGKENAGNVRDVKAQSTALSKLLPKGVDASNVIDAAAAKLARKAEDYTFSPDEFGETEYLDFLAKEVASASGISVADAKAKLSASGDLEGMLSQVTSKAGTMSEGANYALTESQKEQNTRTAARVQRATENIQEYQGEKLDAIEERLGVHSIFGDKGGWKDFKSWAKGQTTTDLTIMAAMGSGSRRKMDEAKKLYLAGGGKESEWIDTKTRLEKQRTGLDSDSKDFLRDIGEKDLSDVTAWHKGALEEGITGSVRSRAFTSMFTPYSEKLQESLDKTGGAGAITNMQDFVNAFTEENLAAMEKGGKADKAHAGLIKTARKGGAAGKKALSTLAREAATVGGAEVEETATTTASGPAADAARRSLDAASEMASVAQEFAPAVRDFHEAAKMLLDSATIGRSDSFQGRAGR